MSIISTSILHSTIEEIITSQARRENKVKLTISEKQLISLCSKVSQILSKEPQIIVLSGKFVIVGDIHGNLDSLMRIFNHFNYPPETSYIFLGDYVDRGNFSCEVLIFLYSLKVLYPMNIFMIRGNHECDSMASVNGFKNECLKKYSKSLYESFIKSFNYLSIGIELNFSIFCVHGGISPLFKSIESINNDKSMKKPLKEPFPEVINDFLWSDPSNSINGYSESPRTIGKLYGSDATKEFLEKCDHLSLLVRSHEMAQYGYDYPFDDNGKALTIFSSIDYCGCENSGAVAVAGENNIQIEEFEILSPENRKNVRFLFPRFILENRKNASRFQLPNLKENISIELDSDDFQNDNVIPKLAN